MAYNLTRFSVMRNKDILDTAIQAKGASLKIWTNKPRELAYKLREAVAASEKFEDTSYIHRTFKDYVIRVGENFVLIERRERIEITKTEVLGGPAVEMKEPEPKQETLPLPPRIVPEVTTLPEILLTVTSEREDTPVEEYIFPSAQDLSPNAKKRLNDWAKAAGWKYIDQDEKGLTLTRKDVPEELLFDEGEET